ncbi:RNA-binding protein 1-like [Curcuma longa]|uniref:RNA-binding protein 1-like n=1 Tax=Curcuma longa TaxID=136217 RepID=UPI003D9E4E33
MSRPPSAAVGAWSSEPDRGKLFVGGLASDTREEALVDYFARYGEVKEAVVIRDRVTGNARGFGFVKFADPQASESALKEDKKHVIRGRTVTVRRATLRRQLHQNREFLNPEQNGQFIRSGEENGDRGFYNVHSTSTKKIFIGGLPDNVDQHELRSYFEKFGSVVDAVVMFDGVTRRSRGFGFITFSSEEPVAMALQNSHHELNGKLVEVKIATPKDDRKYANNRHDHDYHIAREDQRGARGPFYGPYPGNLYPSYGYYGYVNYVAQPFPPYAYGGLVGGLYSPTGLHGIQYGGLTSIPTTNSWNNSKRISGQVMHPDVVKRSGGDSVSVIDNVHEFNGNNENQNSLDVESQIGAMAGLDLEDVQCDAQ